MLDDALDRSIFAGRIPTFQDDQYPVIAFDEVPLQLDMSDPEHAQGVLIGLVRKRGRVPARFWLGDFLTHGYCHCLTHLRCRKL